MEIFTTHPETDAEGGVLPGFSTGFHWFWATMPALHSLPPSNRFVDFKQGFFVLTPRATPHFVANFSGVRVGQEEAVECDR